MDDYAMSGGRQVRRAEDAEEHRLAARVSRDSGSSQIEEAALVLRGSMAPVVSIATIAGIALTLTPLLVSSLGQRNYGVWVLVGTALEYYGLFDLGLAKAVMRFVSRAVGAGNREDANRYISTGVSLLSSVGLSGWDSWAFWSQ
jgi:Na+-driven multidrug efflux pump